jgi:hypothetical protein
MSTGQRRGCKGEEMYLKEGGDLFSLSRLIVDPVIVGGLSLERTAPRDEKAMVLLKCVVVEVMEGGLVGLASGCLYSLSAPKNCSSSIAIHFCKLMNKVTATIQNLFQTHRNCDMDTSKPGSASTHSFKMY